ISALIARVSSLVIGARSTAAWTKVDRGMSQGGAWDAFFSTGRRVLSDSACRPLEGEDPPNGEAERDADSVEVICIIVGPVLHQWNANGAVRVATLPPPLPPCSI
ncbi:unnamed protein product, partial [Nesidiocoris tenuis]